MKALTLQRPWAAAFLLPTDPKRIENRKWMPPKSLIGQRFALHSGLGWWPGQIETATTEAELNCWASFSELTGVFASAVVTGYVLESPELFDDSDRLGASVRSSRWWLGPVAWVLSDFVALPKAIPCKGAQGLWKLPEAIEQQIAIDLH